MPNITRQIPDSYDAITRPVALQVTRQLIRLMGLPENLAIEFFGSSEVQYQGGSTLTPTPPNKFPFTGKITIEVQETYLEDRMQSAVKQRDNVHYFHDSDLRVDIRPVTTIAEVTISFRYRAESQRVAEQWRDEFHQRTLQGRTLVLHELNYHYGVPPAFQVILHEIFRMREAVAGYGEDLRTWMRNHLSSRATTLVTQAGTRPVLVISETQACVQGAFEFVAQPEKGSKGGDNASWETGFDYKFQYDKVISTVMRYPLLVHNQLMVQKFRPKEPIYELKNRIRQPNRSRFLLDQYVQDLYPPTSYKLTGIIVPTFDEWLPRIVPPVTSSVWTSVIQLDLNDRQDILNLANLGTYDWDPDVFEFLKGEIPYLHTWSESIFHVELFIWADPMEDGTITTDSEFRTRSAYPLNPRDLHHLRIAVINDLTALSPEAIDRLRNHPEAAVKILTGLYPGLYDPKDPKGINRDIIDRIVGGRLIPNKTIKKITDLINGTNNRSNSLERHFYTVGTYGIIAHREQANANS